MRELAQLVDTLPAYAGDLKANFDGLIVRARDEDRTLYWGTIVAAAMVAGSATVTCAAVAGASHVLSAAELDGARMAAAMMTLTNHFYKHHSLTSLPALKNLRAGLRTAGLRKAEKTGSAFKLWCVAVSVLNGCAACVQANERSAFATGATVDQVAGVLRVAALMQAIAVAVEAERAVSNAESATCV